MKKATYIGFLASVMAFSQLVFTAHAEEKLISYKGMNLELALKVAKDTMQACRAEGYQITVAVVDRSGTVQVVIRDQLAGIFTPDIAVRKARTALNFHSDTINLREPTESGKEGSGIRQVPDALMVAGGVMIEAAGSVIGSIGVSGAPVPVADDACARIGLEASDEILNF